MQEILDRCAGLDVHQDSIVACIMVGHGKKNMYKETRTFGAMTQDIEEMGSWLKSHDIEDAAMESTGIYWKPIFNILDLKLNLTLANARNIKNVPGRKTDVKDAEWICQLLKCGLIEKSFIPPETIRFLRDLTRFRRCKVGDLTAAKNRLIKMLEASNLKLASVFSNVYGKTAWKIIKLILSGENNIDVLTAYIPKNVKASKKQIRKALVGTLKTHNIELLRIMVQDIENLEAIVQGIEIQITNHIKQFEVEMNLLSTIPGLSTTTAAIVLAEIGTDMKQFPSSKHLASWAGVAPGCNESAGIKKSSHINQGNRYLKPILIQSAHAAVKNKDTYYHTIFSRLSRRIGSKKKTLVAIGRKILTAIYYVLSNKIEFKELGSKYVDPKMQNKRINYYKKQLEELGQTVILQSSNAVTTA